MPTAVNRVVTVTVNDKAKATTTLHAVSQKTQAAQLSLSGRWGENHLSESSTVAAVRLHNQNNRETVTIASENHVVNKRKRCILVAWKMRGAVVSLG